jgi:hypothetical protein
MVWLPIHSMRETMPAVVSKEPFSTTLMRTGATRNRTTHSYGTPDAKTALEFGSGLQGSAKSGLPVRACKLTSYAIGAACTIAKRLTTSRTSTDVMVLGTGKVVSTLRVAEAQMINLGDANACAGLAVVKACKRHVAAEVIDQRPSVSRNDAHVFRLHMHLLSRFLSRARLRMQLLALQLCVHVVPRVGASVGVAVGIPKQPRVAPIAIATRMQICIRMCKRQIRM